MCRSGETKLTPILLVQSLCIFSLYTHCHAPCFLHNWFGYLWLISNIFQLFLVILWNWYLGCFVICFLSYSILLLKLCSNITDQVFYSVPMYCHSSSVTIMLKLRASCLRLESLLLQIAIGLFHLHYNSGFVYYYTLSV